MTDAQGGGSNAGATGRSGAGPVRRSGAGPVKRSGAEPDASDEARVDAVFRALADPTRRAVLRLLADEGVATPTGLAAVLPVSRQAVTKHLGALTEAGLAQYERAGRQTRYRFRAAGLHEAVQWMTAVGAAWDRRLDTLATLLED